MRLVGAAAAVVVLGAMSAAQDGDAATAAAVRRALEAADALAPESPSAGLVGADATTQAAVRDAAAVDASTTVRLRAARLVLAWDLADVVRAAQPAPGFAAWLALDEIDADVPEPQRAALLARALPEEKARSAALGSLREGREAARRFCLEWNELEAPGTAAAEVHGERKAALEAAGERAAPHLLRVLAAPAHTAFVELDPARGVTARQQVRALHAVGMLRLAQAAPHLVLHARSPSFTAATIARSFLAKLTGQEFGDDEAAAVRAIDAWWEAHRHEHRVALDHLVRHTLRALRGPPGDAASAASWWERFGVDAAREGARTLSRITGRALEFDAHAAPAERAAALDAVELRWLASRPPPAPAGDVLWPSAPGDDGRTRLRIEAVLRTPPWTQDGDDTLQIQGRVESDEPGLLLSDLHGAIRVVTADGAEHAYGRERCQVLEPVERFVSAVGLELGPAPRRLRSIEFEFRTVRVKTWETARSEAIGSGATRTFVATPFEFSVSGEERTVHVAACSTEASLRGMKERWDLLSHRWAAAAAEVVDADGERLVRMMSAGSGGATVQSFVREGAGPVAYPVSVSIRIPATWEDRIVRYRFADLDVSRAAVQPR